MTSETVSASSWFTTLVGAALLLGLGFGTGLVAGVVTEDPGLVWAHVSGDSIEAPLPSVASSRDRGAGEGAASRIPATREPGDLAGFSVQVGAFAERTPAVALRDRLAKDGFDAYLAGEVGAHRVRVGPVAERPQAETLARSLAEKKLPTWILQEGE